MSVERDKALKSAVSYGEDMEHPLQVAGLAEQLFNELGSLHELGETEREMLVSAAFLHDIGWCGGQQKHHKRAYEMIVARPPEGFEPKETAIVANIARYHRKALPKSSHVEFAALGADEKNIVRRLASLLRIADGLDRTHHNLCSVDNCVVTAESVSIVLVTDGYALLEIAAAKEKSDLFLEVFGREVEFQILGKDTPDLS